MRGTSAKEQGKYIHQKKTGREYKITETKQATTQINQSNKQNKTKTKTNRKNKKHSLQRVDRFV